MRLSNRGRAVIYAGAAVVAVALISLLVWYLLQPRYVLRSKLVTSQPAVDGKAGDPVWAQAEALTVPQGRDAGVEIKSVYTPETIFFLVKFKSQAPNMTERRWRFDGKNWQLGGVSDQLGLFFEVGETMPGFERRGFGDMTFGLTPQDSLWQFGQVGPASQTSVWEGAHQTADYWLWGSGVTNPWGKAADLYYSINREYVGSPHTVDPILRTQWDSSTNAGVLTANSRVWWEAIAVSAGGTNQPAVQDAPQYIYKKGKTFANDPYPVFEDLAPIPEGHTFKKGDELPYIYFDSKAKGRWGGSWDDVDARGVWKDGYWTIELRRRMNTRNNDDIRFVPPTTNAADYHFAVLTRTGGVINKSVPAVLRLMPNGGS